jgi:predicted dehydrogenase
VSPEGRLYRGSILGLGGIARQAHWPAFRDDPALQARTRIVAAVDPSPNPTPAGGPPRVERLTELERFAPIDFVDICTPTASHLDLTLWALERGYHVLCEKPVALGRAEAGRLATAARLADRVVMPCHQYRFNPAWQRLRELLTEGAIGRWHLAEMQVYRQLADPGIATQEQPWRGREDTGRGGVLLDHGTHLIYSLLDVGGRPQSVQCWTGRLRHQGYDVEDSANLLLEFPGRLAIIFLTWAAHHRENRIRFIGEDGTIEWIGGRLTIRRGDETETEDFSAQLDKSAYAGWFASLFRDFVGRMDQRDADSGLEDIQQVAEILESAYQSARTGRRVDLVRSA